LIFPGGYIFKKSSGRDEVKVVLGIAQDTCLDLYLITGRAIRLNGSPGKILWGSLYRW
jgi:hypothetical protein